MAALTDEEKVARLNPELQSLLDARKVDVAVQAGLFDVGVDSLGMLSAIAVTRAELEEFAKNSLGIDGVARPGDVVKFATVYLAWQSATNRIKVQDELNSELAAQKQPKDIPPMELLSLKAQFEKNYYKMKDSEVPARASFEDLCEQLDAGELRAMSLRHFGSKSDDEEVEAGTLQLGKSGQVKIRKGKVETAAPVNMEELRCKIVLMANHFLFAKMRYANRSALANLSPFTFLDFLGYLTGKHVAQMETQTVDGISLHRPSIKLLINYEHQMRKEVIEQVNSGKDMASEWQLVVKNADIRERHFSTPLAVSSAAQSLEGSHKLKDGGHRSGPYDYGPGKGKHKGKGKGKGKGKYKGDFLHSTTPDGRQLCFAWNNKSEGCKDGSCSRVHACRICLSPSHPTFLHKGDHKKTEGGGGTGDS